MDDKVVFSTCIDKTKVDTSFILLQPAMGSFSLHSVYIIIRKSNVKLIYIYIEIQALCYMT